MLLRAPGPDPIRLNPVPPSAAVESWYERELLHGVDQMNADTLTVLQRVYKNAPQPVLPLTFSWGELKTALDTLEEKWERTFNYSADEIALRFVRMNLEHHDRAFAHALTRVGVTVPRVLSHEPDAEITLDEFSEEQHPRDGHGRFSTAEKSDEDIIADARRLYADPRTVERYKAMKGSDGGRKLDVDLARELDPNYMRNPTRVAELHHRSVSDFITRLWEEKLSEPLHSAPGKEYVVVLAGGGGSGKGTVRDAFKLNEGAHVLYDGTMSKYDKAERVIEQALHSGRKVIYDVVLCPPDKAVNNMVSRAHVDKLARVVMLDTLAGAHIGAPKVALKLMEKYADNPNVAFRVFMNDGGLKDIREVPQREVKAKIAEYDKGAEIINHVSAAWLHIERSGYAGFSGKTEPVRLAVKNTISPSWKRLGATGTDRALEAGHRVSENRVERSRSEGVAQDAKKNDKPFWSDFALKFDLTPLLQETIKTGLKENIDLISTKRIKDGPAIPRKNFARIRQMARESVERGRDLAGFTKDLETSFGITRRRASLIARDQNNKMTSAFHRTRQLDCGITKAVWIHTAASMQPREEHEQWGEEGAIYDVAEGMYSEVDGEEVWPGTPVNCGCLAQSIIPGYKE